MELFNETGVISSLAIDTETSLNDEMNTEQPIGEFTNDCVATSAISINASETFIWISNICSNIRANIRTDQSEKSVLEVFRSYIRKIRDDMPNCIRMPNRCYVLSRNITKMLMVFKSLSNDFADTHEYLINACELLSIYTTLELRYSTKFKESKIAVANRISTNFDIHLPKMNEKYVLKTLMSIKNIYRQKEIMRKLYEKYLVPRHQNGFQKELNDDEYVMYLVNYKLWKCFEDEYDEKLRIDIIANSFMKPSNTLRKNFAYAPYIPKFKSKIDHATKDILSQNFKISCLMKAIEDKWRRHQNSSNIVVDISSDSANDWNVEDVQMTPLSFPKIKLENPEVIATVDLTDDHSPQNDKQLDWLDCLVTKVRATTVSGRSEQIVEIINLVDSDCADEEFEPISQCNVVNLDELSRNSNSNEIHKFPDVDLFSPEFNMAKTCDNNIGGYFNSPPDANISKVDVPSKSLSCLPKENRIVSKENSQEHIEYGTNVSEVCRAMKVFDTVSSKAVDSNCNISKSYSQTTSDDVFATHEITQNENHCQGQLIGLQQSTGKNSNLMVDSLDKVNYSKAVTEPCLSNPGDKNQDIQGELSIYKDYVCNDPARLNSNQVELREQNETLLTPTRNLCMNIDSKTNAEELIKGEENTSHFKRRHQSPVNIKTYSNKHKKSSDKACVSPNISAFENIQPDLNSLQYGEIVETPNKIAEREALIVNKATNSIEKSDDLNKTDESLMQKLSDPTISIENTDYIMGLNRSSSINQPAKYSEDYRFEDEDEDYLIKNIAKKLTVHSKKYQGKKRNDVSDTRDIHNTSENTLLDIPVFTSSSDENDDSGESNILSILDESDNSKEDSINYRLTGEADSDTHVRKISPKTDICDIKRTNVDNIIFRVSSENRLSSLIPKNVDVKSFASNVVFSTTKSKHIDQTRSDCNADMAEVNGSLSHPEITSPPMEEFTKSDKTLFKTFLKKTNDSTKFAPIESDLDKLLGTDLIPLENNNKKYEAQVVNEQTPTTRKIVDNLVFSSACNRRKTVSFFGVGDEDKTKDYSYNKVPQIGSQNASKKPVLSGKECWTATINTYRSKNQQLATPSSSTHASLVRPMNNSTINTKGNGGSPSPLESGTTCMLAIKENLHDEKLFNARVYVRRVEQTVNNRLSLYNGNKINHQLVAKKIDRGLQRRSYSTLPFNSNKKQTKAPIRRSTLHDGSILTSHRESNSISDTPADIKLKKKIVVNLLDIAQNPEYKKYFRNLDNVRIGVHNENLEKSKGKEDITFSSQRPKNGDYNKWQPDTNVMVNVFQKSKGVELFKRIVGNNNKISSKHKLQEEEVKSKIRKSNSNIVDLNKAELDQHIVTSSINPPVELGMSSSSGHGVEKARNFNDLVHLDHILNDLQTPTSAKVKTKRHYSAPRKLSNKFKLPANEGESRINPKHRVWYFQREMDENQVTSTQDNIPIDTNNAFPSKFHSEVDVQHDFVDTTQNYSQFSSPLSVMKDARNRYDSHDYPTTTTNFENGNPNEEMMNYRIIDDKMSNTTLNTNSLISIASTFNKVTDANSTRQASNQLSGFSPSHSDLTYKNCILDMSKTYSSINSIKTVFVPPEIEKIIEGDGN